MTYFVGINKASVAVKGAEASPYLTELIAACDSDCRSDTPDFELSHDPGGLRLVWNTATGKPLTFQLDFLKIVHNVRSFPAPKQGAFNQALGKKTKRVIDATGGWGGDAILMCVQGYAVTVFERNPLMAILLKEAFRRLAESDWARHNPAKIPVVENADACEQLDWQRYPADCVYMDPMFPPKRKKSAAANKQMQMLHYLVDQDLDASHVLERALATNYPRIAVKRPDYAEPLLSNPDTQFSSKLVHYDVYLNK